MEVFEAKEHICKFGFELFDHAAVRPLKYNILCNVYQRELIIEFLDKRNENIVEQYGFTISDNKLQELLPFIRWKDFEKYRNLSDSWSWNFNNGHCGYRDGWGYRFWCLSESGMPMIEIYMDCIFNKSELPSHEKLLDWLRKNYSSKKQLEPYRMLW